MKKTLKLVKYLFLYLLAVITFSCQNTPKEKADAIWHNGTILTMEGNQPEYVEAIATKGSKILQTGTFAAINQLKSDSTIIHDLEGKTLLPGFIEPHLHPILATILIQTEIIAFNDWNLPHGQFLGVKNQEDYLKRLDVAVEKSQGNMPLITWGFHPLYHDELNRDFLDNRYGEKPVVIWQYSFHEIILNSAAIQLLGIDEAAASQHPQVEWERGRFFERGMQQIVAPKLLPYILNPQSAAKGMQLTAQAIEKGGVTTVADMAMPLINFDLEWKLIKNILDSKEVPFRTYLIPNAAHFSPTPDKLETTYPKVHNLTQFNTTKVQFLKQVKLLADGAFYAQLMQMKEPYTDGHHGEWITPPEALRHYIPFYWEKDYRIHVHVNGDLGAEKVLDILDTLQQQQPKEDHRFTLHHLGYVTESQVQRMAKLGVQASVQPYYVYGMGSKYAQHGLGQERAQRISPVGYLIDNGIMTCFHSDFFMAPVEPLTLMWVAVNRKTIDGKTFGAELKISAWEALKAVTINAAHHLNQEDFIGSIRAGKSADFVILDKNPLEVPVEEINQVKVERTVFEGRTSK